MKYALLAGLAAVLFGVLVLAVQPFQSGPPGSSSSRTIYSFTYALAHHNFGRACSYLSDEARGAGDACSAGLTANDGLTMILGGVDVFAGTHVVPGSLVVVSDTRVVYKIASDEIPPVDVVVEKGANGLWRITQIGGST